MKYFSLVLCIASLSAALAIAAEKPKPAETAKRPATQTYEDAITAGPLPEGYAISKQDLMDGDKKLGTQLLVTKEETIGKVAITIDGRVPKTDSEKLTFIKGYINGNGKALSQLGLNLIDRKIPPEKELNPAKRMIGRLTFQKPDNEKLYVEIQVFFANVGYNLIVMADSEEQLNTLSAWARTVRGLSEPAAPEAKGEGN